MKWTLRTLVFLAVACLTFSVNAEPDSTAHRSIVVDALSRTLKKLSLFARRSCTSSESCGMSLFSGDRDGTAAAVHVRAHGKVDGNLIRQPPLAEVKPGEQVIVDFTVTAARFVPGYKNASRGYVLDASSFQLSFHPSNLTVKLLDSAPSKNPGYFTIAHGAPFADGFWISSTPISPGGVPLTQEPVNLNLEIHYAPGKLKSLNVEDARGAYGYDGLTSFGFSLWEGGPDNIGMNIDFTNMTLS